MSSLLDGGEQWQQLLKDKDQGIEFSARSSRPPVCLCADVCCKHKFAIPAGLQAPKWTVPRPVSIFRSSAQHRNANVIIFKDTFVNEFTTE